MADDIRKSLQEIIADEAPIDLLACYEGTVVQQRADGTFDVKVDDVRFGAGLVGVPYRVGVPGMTCVVPKGARCVVGFENLRRDCPVVRMFEQGTPTKVKIETVTEVEIKSAGKAIVDGATIELGGALALLGVARQTDPVQAGPWAGTITGASLLVKSK
ncbi:MAG: hypothetical protein PHU49_15785 [Syntrophorhabdaceae bacterium]|nr:hypothetical protein [Syntrophorhabdaceae bacterium]